MALTQKQLQDVCLMFQHGQQCRYLDEDTDDGGNVVHVCRKQSPLKAVIDDEIDLFMDDMKKNGQDPTAQGVALGDNCSGYTVLKSKPQGYDV